MQPQCGHGFTDRRQLLLAELLSFRETDATGGKKAPADRATQALATGALLLHLKQQQEQQQPHSVA